MKINLLKGIVFLLSIFISCEAMAQSNVKDTLVDPVTGKKVDKSESYDWIYAGKKYYFSSYDSRASFKMNPQKFLLNQCTSDMTATDLVTGEKVNKTESYDMKYKGQRYYFESYESKETFKMNPEKFLKNKCAPRDSIK